MTIRKAHNGRIYCKLPVVPLPPFLQICMKTLTDLLIL